LNWNTLAIDGPGGAGKSALATQLANDLGATIIPMGAFLLPERKHRISAIAKNYDLDRFFEEVMDNLLAKKDICYRVMDLISGELKHEKVTIPAGQKVIVEGIYSLELSFRDSYDLSIFVDAPKKFLMERAFEFEAGATSWLDKWLPGEETYLAAQHPKLGAMLVLDGTQPFPPTSQIMEALNLRLAEGLV
jgi:cytidylate kinase